MSIKIYVKYVKNNRDFHTTKLNLPTGNLDTQSGQIVIDALTEINEKMKKTILMVTHDPKMASYCSRIILLKDGQILEELKREKDQDAFYHRIVDKMQEL